jgi:hypothetical protein
MLPNMIPAVTQGCFGPAVPLLMRRTSKKNPVARGDRVSVGAEELLFKQHHLLCFDITALSKAIEIDA